MQKITQELKLVVIITGFFSFLIFSFPNVSSAQTIVLNATEDSGMLDGDDTNDPFPGILYSELDTGEPGDVWLSIIKFDLSSLVGVEIKSATLELTSNFNHNSDSFIHEIFSSSDDNWTENEITGINRPLNATMTLLDATEISGTSQTYAWNTIAGVTGADGLAGTNNLLTLIVIPRLSQAGNAFGPHFDDSSSSSGFPRLIINAESDLPDGTNCISTFNTNGLLSIPCITVPDEFGRKIVYQAELKLIPSSNPFSFENGIVILPAPELHGMTYYQDDYKESHLMFWKKIKNIFDKTQGIQKPSSLSVKSS